MNPPTTYVVPSEWTSPVFGQAFAEGCGGTVSDKLVLEPGDVAMFGSPRRWSLLQQAQAEGRTWYYGDHAYIGRHQHYRITRNRYQHDGSGPGDPDRFAALGHNIQPWRTHGEHIVICPNSEKYFTLFGLDAQTWVNQVLDTLRKYTRRQVIIRWKWEARRHPIERDLRGAWAVVVFSSASALDALLAGIPVFVLAPWAAGYRMGTDDLSQITRPPMPDGREAFFAALAANQWTLNEIRSGMAWEALSNGV